MPAAVAQVQARRHDGAGKLRVLSTGETRWRGRRSGIPIVAAYTPAGRVFHRGAGSAPGWQTAARAAPDRRTGRRSPPRHRRRRPVRDRHHSRRPNNSPPRPRPAPACGLSRHRPARCRTRPPAGPGAPATRCCVLHRQRHTTRADQVASLCGGRDETAGTEDTNWRSRSSVWGGNSLSVVMGETGRSDGDAKGNSHSHIASPP